MSIIHNTNTQWLLWTTSQWCSPFCFLFFPILVSIIPPMLCLQMRTELIFLWGYQPQHKGLVPAFQEGAQRPFFCLKFRLLFFPHKSHFVPVQPEQHLSFYPPVIQHCQVVLQFFTLSPCLYDYRWLHTISKKHHLPINFISMSFINVETSERDAIPAEIHQWTFSTRGRRGCKGHSLLCPVSYLLANPPPIQPHKHFRSTLHVLYLP